MPRSRFKEIIRFLRFDNFQTRAERKAANKLAPFQEVFDLFVTNCKQCYNPNAEMCIDEQLVPFKGRCPFRVYMKSKPDKYGIKIWALCDTKNSYACNLQIYIGKINNVPEKEQGKRVVKDLISHLGAGYGFTTDNFFTSLQLAKDLYDKKQTLVGTMRQNRCEVPKEMLPNKDREVTSSIFLFSRESTMVSYVPKKRRAVVLLSTQHRDTNVSNEENSLKPQIILDYNHTKAAVDTLDKMVKEYACNRSTRRWPLVLFMNCLDIAAVNAYVLYKLKYPEYEKGKSCQRRLFLKQLGLELVRPLIQIRVDRGFNGVHKHIQLAMSTVIDISQRSLSSPIRAPKRGRCLLCPRQRDTKYSTKCDSCENFICKDHVQISTTKICNSCSHNNS